MITVSDRIAVNRVRCLELKISLSKRNVSLVLGDVSGFWLVLVVPEAGVTSIQTLPARCGDAEIRRGNNCSV
jgi:hypothetical protein